MSNGGKFFNWANLTVGLVGALAGVGGLAYAGWLPMLFSTDTRFSCSYEPDTIGGGQVWTVMYRTPKEKPKPWLKMITALGDDYTPQKRCEKIADRLDIYRKDGLTKLSYQKDQDTNQYIICAKTRLGGENSCPLLMTLKPGADPYLSLRQMTEGVLQGEGVYQNSQGLPAKSISPESPEINLQNFLGEEDR